MLAITDRQYSSTGLIGEEKKAKKAEMEDKINNDEIKKTSQYTHVLPVLPVPGTSPNTCCVVVLCLF